tara:strand:- start:60 stop:281 length:222 start_codon:yes stop_codon:yes gene_type:complete
MGTQHMAKAPTRKKKAAKRTVTKAKVSPSAPKQAAVAKKNSFEANFGEGTAFDLDYGKLVIIALLIYVAYQVS